MKPTLSEPDFQQLRERFLLTPRRELSESVEESTAPWGAIMEIGYPEAVVVAIAAFADGEVNVVRSCGGHYLHAENRQSVRLTGSLFLQKAALVQNESIRVARFPLPATGEIFFYFRRDDGVYAVHTVQAGVSNRRDALSRLFYAGLAVLHDVQIAVL